MALNKPTFKVNVGANARTTERKTVYYDLKPDTRTRLRVLPPVTEDGLIFTKVTNHFKLKNEENFGMALACLEDHGNDETGEVCYLCELVKYLKKTGDKGDAKIAGDLKCNPRWYMQALIYDESTGEYVGPKLVGLSKTTAEAVNEILVNQEDSGDDFFCDPENGQDLVITRKGSGLNTRYTVAPTGNKASLDDIFPAWEEKIITDIYAAIDLKVQDQDGQKRAVYRTFDDDLDWEAIQENVG
jgi:hypothetical protein